MVSGHVGEAVRAFKGMAELWYKHRALPDIYDHQKGATLSYAKDYPLRPEMVLHICYTMLCSDVFTVVVLCTIMMYCTIMMMDMMMIMMI